MKSKFLAISLCAVIGLSTFALFGCTPETKIYEIDVKSSNETQGGSVHGRGAYKSNSTVTLEAVPHQEDGFLAWVKDDEQIVSYDKEYSFIASKETAGKYTALFANSNYEFAKLSDIFFNISSFKMIDEFIDNSYESKITSWTLEYNTITTLYKNLATMDTQNLEDGDNEFDTFSFDEKLFYLDKTYNFKLTINFQYTSTSNQQTVSEPLISIFSVNFADIFKSDNKKTQDSGGKITTKYITTTHTLTLEEENSSKFTLNLDYNNLTKSSTYWDTNNDISQQLTLVFDYPLTNITKE